MLGIGATATVAAWTDETHSTAQFEAGSFAIEVYFDGTWQSTHTMQFNADSWYPGYYEITPVLIRTSPDTTVAGDLKVVGQGALGDLAPYLQYQATATNLNIQEVENFSCPETLDSSSDFIFGAQEPYVSLDTPAEASGTQTVAAAGSDVVAYCFEIRLGSDAPNDVQNTSANHTWTFEAQSRVPE